MFLKYELESPLYIYFIYFFGGEWERLPLNMFICVLNIHKHFFLSIIIMKSMWYDDYETQALTERHTGKHKHTHFLQNKNSHKQRNLTEHNVTSASFCNTFSTRIKNWRKEMMAKIYYWRGKTAKFSTTTTTTGYISR